MKTTTTYDWIDWKLVAKRVKSAFGVQGECEFVENGGSMWLCPPINDPLSVYEILYGRKTQVDTVDGLKLEFIVDRQEVAIQLSSGEGRRLLFTHLTIRFDGTVADLGPINEHYIPEMTKGLFYLDLLSPEVETTLNVSVSAHQKLEWMMEYEQRLSGRGIINSRR